MRVLGLDYGTVRIGVAVSDPGAVIAQPRDFIKAEPRRECLKQIAALCEDLGVARIVIGLPKHMNGDEGESAKAARTFGDAVNKETGLPVVFIDERMTTLSASRSLSEGNVNARGQKDKIDSVAAAIILQNYLDMQI